MNRRLLLSLALLTLATALAGCGLGAAAAKPTPTPDPQKQMLAFTQCMRDHGVNLPDPGSGSGPVQLNVDPTTMDAAQNACRSKLPNGGKSNLSPAEQARMRDALVKFSQCMRQHGINMPDPQFNGNGATVRVDGTGIDPTSPDFQAAQKACESLLPGKPGTAIRSSGSGGGGAGLSVSGGSK